MNQPMSHAAQTIKQESELAETTRKTAKEYMSLIGQQKSAYIYRQIIDEVEKPLLEVIMDMTNGNQSKTAAYLGINRATLRSKLKRHSLI